MAASEGSAPRPIPDGHVRVATLRALPALLASLGADAAAVLRAARIDARLFDDPDAVIPIAVRGRCLALAAEATNCEHLGLLIGGRLAAEDFGWPGRLMLASATVGEALSALQQFWHLHNSALVMLLRRVGEEVEFGCAVMDSTQPGLAVFEDASMMAAKNLLCRMLGAQWCPTVVHLPRRLPRAPEIYERSFSAPCRFNAPASVIRFPAEVLQQSLPHASFPAAAATLARLRSEALAADSQSWTDRVRRMAFTLLMQGGCSQQNLAEAIGLSSRTMNRRLAAAGVSYVEIVDAARYSVSRRLLRETDMSLADVARVLGYVEPASFTRAFRRWAGMSPARWRIDKADGTR